MQAFNTMKKFLVKLFIFLLIIIAIDFLFGIAMKYVIANNNSDEIGRDKFICDKMVADVLVFGSSRAEHHYNTVMMTDSLKMKSYNCGQAGYGIILSYGRLQMILKRYIPKIIIYDITPDFDILDLHDNPKHLYRLKPFYEREGIDSIFWTVDPTEKYKMISNMYQHNSSYLRNIVSCLFSISTDDDLMGYEPLEGEMDTMKIDRNHIDYEQIEGYKIDSVKIYYIRKFIEMAKLHNINIVFVSSPVWYGQNSRILEPIQKLCTIYEVQLYDYSNEKKYIHQNCYFKDGVHLNSKGADLFTKDFIRVIK